jgi:hypothetical protein
MFMLLWFLLLNDGLSKITGVSVYVYYKIPNRNLSSDSSLYVVGLFIVCLSVQRKFLHYICDIERFHFLVSERLVYLYFGLLFPVCVF